MIRQSLALAILLVAGYYLTTLALWGAHRSAHVSWCPLQGFHLLGHHALYPSSKACLADKFLFGSGWHDSTYAFIPWLAIEAALIWMVLPTWSAMIVTVEAALVVWLFSLIHEQVHLTGSRFNGSFPFERARARHFFHHDHDANFALFDHFWDRIFSTYHPPKRTEQQSCESCS